MPMPRLLPALISALVLATMPAGSGAQTTATEPDTARASQAGREAGSGFSGGWFGRGLVGGLIGGPVGTMIVFSRAGRSDATPPPSREAELGPHSLEYSRAFREAYGEQVRLKRKESAFVGGMIGTAVFSWAVIRAIDLLGGISFTGDPPDPPDPGA